MPKRKWRSRQYRESDPLADALAAVMTFFLFAVIWYVYTHREQLLTWGSIVLVVLLVGAAAVLIFRKLKTNAPLDWDDDKILGMLKGGTPAEFEREVAEMFEALGYKTQVVG